MHIAMFSDFHPSTLGGIQHSVNDQRRELERRGHRVTFFAPDGPSDTEIVGLTGLLGMSVNGYPAVLPTPRNLRLVDAELTRRGPVDVVHVHTTYGAGVIGAKAARRHGIPLVQTMHSRDDTFIENTSPAPAASAAVMRFLHSAFISHRSPMPRVDESAAARHAWRVMIAQARAADAVIAPTQHFASQLRRHGLGTPITVISNGIDDAMLTSARPGTETDDAPNGRADPLRVLWCGRVSAEKRPLPAIAAVAMTDGCTLDLIGDGDQLDDAHALIGDLGARDRITVHGRLSRTDTLTQMANHDVLLFTSVDFDTQGLVLLEAAALGLPVIYCDPALGETVPAGAGIRADGDSAAAIAGALARVRDQPDLLTRARKTLRDSDTAASVGQSTLTDRTVDLYRELVESDTVRRRTLPSGASEVPVAPGRVLVLGHSLVALRRGLHFVGSLRTIGPVVRLDLGPQRAYLLTTPELIRQVGFRTAGDFHRDDLRAAMHEAIREASNVLSGPRHELRRRQMAPALRQRRLMTYAATTARIADRWSRELPSDRVVDLKTEAHGLILQTVTSTLFTADFGTDATEHIRETVPWLLGQVIIRGALPTSVQRFRVIANRRFASRSKDLRTAIGAVVTQYRADDRDHNDVLSVLVRHTDPETGAQLSDNEIIDELLLMVAAGVGSTASILAWVWHEVMTDPDVTDKVVTEVRHVVGDGPVDPHHLTELTYLRRVVLETLRKWGPWISSQTADGAVTFGDDDSGRLTLPAESMIVYSPYLVLHDPRYFTDPERFDPDRWAPGRVDDLDKQAILAFGVGERHCPGSNFAVNTIMLATAALFAHRTPRPAGRRRITASTTDFVASPSRLPVTLGPA